MLMMQTRRYTIKELSEETGFPVRTIRYYIQIGLLEPPAGRGRGGFYFDSHLKRLQAIRKYQDQGLRLEAIRRLLEGKPQGQAETSPETLQVSDVQAVYGVRTEEGPEAVGMPERAVWARYEVIPGVEVHVRRDLEAHRGRAVQEWIRILRTLIQEEEDHG